MRKLLFILLAGVTLASCSKDPNLVTNEALEGDWNITSYKIEGQEVYGSDGFFDNGTMKFTMDEDFTGSMELTVTAFPGTVLETTQTNTGTYEISNEGQTITIKDTDGEETVSSVTIEESTVTMEYTEDGETVKITADKQS